MDESRGDGETFTPGPFRMEPIGWVRSPYRERFGTPQQAAAVGSDAEAVLALDPARIPAEALADLEGIERLWVVTLLHLVDGWRPRVQPPRGPRQKRGVFATRSPHRPNPLGLSAVTLVRVEGTNLHVRGIDILDGTPILDVKPYVPYADAFPEARAGWIDTIPRDAPQVGRPAGARHRRRARDAEAPLGEPGAPTPDAPGGGSDDAC